MTSTALAIRPEQQQLLGRVRDTTFREQVEMALPPSTTPERFLRIAATAVLTNPDIAKLEHTSVLQALVQAAAAGLMPDGKEGAITPRGGKAVWVPMIGGFRKKAAEHGWTLRTAVVYANDQFEHHVIDGEEIIKHSPVRPGAERGDLVAAYAIAKHRDGRKMMVVLHPADIAKRRASASTDKVWTSHPAAMWEKSAGRDLYDQLGLPEIDGPEMMRRLVEELAPKGAALAMYGVPTDSSGDLPPFTGPDQPEQPEDRQQATPPTGPAAATAGGAVPDEDEPLVGEVIDEDEPAVLDEAVAELGRAAAMYVVPDGKEVKGKSLGEVYELGEPGRNWLAWALEKKQRPAGFQEQIRNFCRVYLPEVYASVMGAS